MKNIKEQIQVPINLYKSGNLVKAEEVTKKLIQTNPKLVFLYNLLGLILSGRKKIIESLRCYEKGLEIDANFAMLHNNLGHLYFSYNYKNNEDKIEKYYKKAIFLDNKISEPHNNLGNLYKEQGKFDEAIICYKNAIDRNPEVHFFHYNLATTYITLGEVELAINSYEKSLKINPNFSLTHRALSRIKKYKKNDKYINHLLKIYENLNKNDFNNKVELAFALGKIYEDMEEFKKSFNYYKEANDSFKKKINFSINEELNNFKNLKDSFNNEIFYKYKNRGNKDDEPIFIVGMPRSGTTLVEQIISSHSDVFGGDEVNFIPNLYKENFSENYNYEKIKDLIDKEKINLNNIGKHYIEEMKKITKNKLRFTDKLPLNFLHIGFIKLILPRAKIVHCFRDPRDNCYSIFKNHFTSNKIKYAYDLNEIVKYYLSYLDLMKFWRELLPNFIYDLKYENLINNTKNETENLLRFCNLAWDKNCLNFYKNKRPIQTASDIQARQKIYNTSINSWKKNKKELKKYFINLKI